MLRLRIEFRSKFDHLTRADPMFGKLEDLASVEIFEMQAFGHPLRH